MQLQHTFTVPGSVDRAWSTLLDVEAIAPCFPGASLTGVEGDEFSGTVKVRLGPVSLQYAGKGRFVERDEAARRVVLEAHGTDRRGNGTAGATVHARLEPDGEDATRVTVDTDLKVTGRPAQFGRGVLQDVSGRIIEQFAGCLAARMSAPEAAAPEAAAPEAAAPEAAAPEAAAPEAAAPEVPASAAAGETTTTPGGAPASPSPLTNVPPPARLDELGEPEPASPDPQPVAELDLGAAVLPTLARRYGPAMLAGLVAVFVVWLLRRRTR